MVSGNYFTVISQVEPPNTIVYDANGLIVEEANFAVAEDLHTATVDSNRIVYADNIEAEFHPPAQLVTSSSIDESLPFSHNLCHMQTRSMVFSSQNCSLPMLLLQKLNQPHILQLPNNGLAANYA